MRFEWTNRTGEVDGHIVYVLYSDDEERPLYVGMTSELVNRLAGHRNSKRGRKEWYREITLVAITHFDSSAEAAAAERTYIRELNPIHNFVRYAEVS